MTDLPGTPELACDLLIAGSGAGGLAAAVTASQLGLDVIVIEKESLFGGTTCYSAGVAWIPANAQARALGIADSAEMAVTYLEAEGGNRLDRVKAETYVRTAADVLEWFEANSHVRFALVPGWPDYHPERPGALPGGRSLGPTPFDGRTLGERFADLRPPLSTTTILGGMMVGREDLVHFYGMQHSTTSFAKVARLFARYAWDRLRYPRGTRLSNGSALIAMLARTAFEKGVRLILEAPMLELIHNNGQITGAVVGGPDGTMRIAARRGVVLATGGFPANRELRVRLGDDVASGDTHRSLAPAGNVGDGFRIGRDEGAAVVDNQSNAAAWTPVSLVPGRDGGTTPFPHFFDRGKAGYIAVTRQGRRFVNEAVSYHDFVPAMVDACRDAESVECFLVTDAKAIRRYGLGMAPPAPGRLGPHVASGYIERGETLAELARNCGIDPSALEATVTRFNKDARDGLDADFGKGGDVYQRFNGSAGVSPNPCVQPLTTAPFYAIRLVPGDIGTFAGLKTDADGRVLDRNGAALPGLYAVGNDAASFMGGAYPGAGITIGPALVFGHRAALCAAQVSRGAAENA